MACFSVIIGADACNLNTLGDTVDAGCYRRAHRERADYYLEVYRGRDHGFVGHDGRVSALARRHDESGFSAARPAFLQAPASEKHPFGYGKERFFWSFIAAIFIFGVGATYALYEGSISSRTRTRRRISPGLTGCSASRSCSKPVRSGSPCIRRLSEAQHEGMTFGQYLRESKDPTAKTVLFEDTAALLGIIIAGVGIYLTDHQVGPASRPTARRLLGRRRVDDHRRRARHCRLRARALLARVAARRGGDAESGGDDSSGDP